MQQKFIPTDIHISDLKELVEHSAGKKGIEYSRTETIRQNKKGYINILSSS
jgi:hypothetical protein